MKYSISSLTSLLYTHFGKSIVNPTFEFPSIEVYWMEWKEKQVLDMVKINLYMATRSSIDWDDTEYVSSTGGHFRMKGNRVEKPYLLNSKDIFKIIFNLRVS